MNKQKQNLTLEVVKSFWQGKRPLWQAFWVVFFLGGILFSAILHFIFITLYEAVSPVAIIIHGLLFDSYWIFAFIIVVRCRKNVKNYNAVLFPLRIALGLTGINFVASNLLMIMKLFGV